MHFTKTDKRIWLKGLILECPMGEALPDCPLNGMRHLPVAQINQTINNLPPQKVDLIIKIHKHCYHDRMKAASPPTP